MLSKQLLDKKLVENATVASKCEALYRGKLGTEEDFLLALEAFLVNISESSLSTEHLGPFESYLHNNRKASDSSKGMLGKRPPEISQAANLPAIKKLAIPSISERNNTINNSHESTGIMKGSFEQSLSQSTTINYGQRTGSGQVVATFIPRISQFNSDRLSTLNHSPRRCTVSYENKEYPNIKDTYRYMYTTLDERAFALERHLLKLQKKMCLMHNIPEDNLQPVGTPSQDMVWCCGRICTDVPDGRISKDNVILEGSRKHSGGRRVSLDLQSISSPYSLFPGQIILVEGINSSGRSFVAKRIIDGADPERIPIETNVSKEPLSIMMAAGPFTTTDNLEYEPLRDFLGIALTKRPDLIILTGPFVDASSVKMGGEVYLDNEAGGSFPASFEIIFVRKIVQECVTEFYAAYDSEELHTQIILIPSLLDAHHEFVFPQPPFGERESLESSFVDIKLGSVNFPFSRGNNKKVHLLSNPCVFDVDGVRLAVCSNDTLFALSSDEVSQQLGGNRLAYLASHVMKQNSFFPLFPTPPSIAGQLDWRQAQHWELNVMPDIVLFPSKLNVFAKEYNGSLLVNPGYLAKGKSGGTFAEIYIIRENADFESCSPASTILESGHIVIKKI